MSNIKKAYQPIVDFLEANQDVKVSKVLAEVRNMASAKTASRVSNSFIRNTAGEVVAIHDYYFKRWMPLVGDKAVEFGSKKGTPTGYNPMCKKGVSNWTRQQKEAKQANSELLNRVASGEVAPGDIIAEQEAIEAARNSIVETDLGFATEDEVRAYLVENGVETAAK